MINELPTYNWKGNDASYEAKHMWVNLHFGKPQKCENCGTSKIPNNKKQWFEWSNISGKYIRERYDWKRLCVPCHKKTDEHLILKGDDHPNAILTEKKVRIIKWALHYGADRKYLANAFSISKSTIESIASNRNWNHIIIF
jgi:hypothetical protein